MNLICQRPGFLNTIPGKVYKSNLSKTRVFEDYSWKSVQIESVKDQGF